MFLLWFQIRQLLKLEVWLSTVNMDSGSLKNKQVVDQESYQNMDVIGYW